MTKKVAEKTRILFLLHSLNLRDKLLNYQSMKSSVEFESLSPNLIVENVNHSVDFYVKQLGFVMVASVPDQGRYNWAMVSRGRWVRCARDASSGTTPP